MSVVHKFILSLLSLSSWLLPEPCFISHESILGLVFIRKFIYDKQTLGLFSWLSYHYQHHIRHTKQSMWGFLNYQKHTPWELTHWGQTTHICVSRLTIVASDNGLSPGRRQAIIWNNVGILSIGLLGTNFSEILIEILTFSFKKMHLKMSSGKRQPFVSASMC